MPESTEQKIKRLEKDYTYAKTIFSRAEGSLEAGMKRLKKEHGFNDIETAQVALEELTKKTDALKKKLDKKLEELDSALKKE